MKIKYWTIRLLTILIIPLSVLFGRFFFVCTLLIWAAVVSPLVDYLFISKLKKEGKIGESAFHFPYFTFGRFMLLNYKD